MKILKKTFFALVIVSFIGLIPINLAAQQNVEISDEIISVNGKEFYVHTVKPKQTLYSISKAYGVDVADIYKYNPDSKKLIEIGQQLKIPKLEKSAVEKEDKAPAQEDGFIYHKVKPGETLYRIMKKYGLKEEVLKEYNKGLTNDIYPGQWIKIPEPSKIVSDKSKEAYKDLIKYKVQPKDNYYQLKKKYNVSKEQLEAINPELKERGLEVGMEIYIPETDSFEVETPEIDFTLEVEVDSIFAEKANTEINFKPCDSLSVDKEEYNIALMIPLYTGLLEDIDVSSEYKIEEESKYPSFEYIHFYEGFLLAADSMAKMGLKIKLYVYDTKADTAEIRKIVNKEEFGTLDLIFGPFKNECLKIILSETNGTNTKVVSPKSHNYDLRKANSHLFCAKPDAFASINGMIDYVEDSLANARFIILHNEKRNELFVSNYIQKVYWKKAAAGGLDTNNFYVLSYKDNAWDEMSKLLNNDKPNVLLNLVDNEAYISNFVRNLYDEGEEMEIYLAGTEKRWKSYKTLEEKYLMRLNLIQITSGFVDYDKSYVKDFVYRFRNEYNAEPNMLAFEGFDLAWHFLNALGNYGTNFSQCINSLDLNTLQTKYYFQNNSPDAWQNVYVDVYQYKDYQLIDKKRVELPDVTDESKEQTDEPIEETE